MHIYEGPAIKSGLSTFSFYFIDLYKNAFYLESAMEALVGRDVEIPRSVFSADIARGTSLEPPEGRSSWKGTITELEDKQFTVSLETCACIACRFLVWCSAYAYLFPRPGISSGVHRRSVRRVAG